MVHMRAFLAGALVGAAVLSGKSAEVREETVSQEARRHGDERRALEWRRDFMKLFDVSVGAFAPIDRVKRRSQADSPAVIRLVIASSLDRCKPAAGRLYRHVEQPPCVSVPPFLL